jgi:hypothetical protein
VQADCAGYGLLMTHEEVAQRLEVLAEQFMAHDLKAIELRSLSTQVRKLESDVDDRIETGYMTMDTMMARPRFSVQWIPHLVCPKCGCWGGSTKAQPARKPARRTCEQCGHQDDARTFGPSAVPNKR